MYTLKELDLWKDKPEKKAYRYEVSGNKWVLLELFKGNIAGEHYHKGLVKIKNPEVNIVIKGKIKYKLIDVNTKEEKEIIVEAPKIIEIHPNTYHELEAIEDSTLIEPYEEDIKSKDWWEL